MISVLTFLGACTDQKPSPEKVVFEDHRKFVERENGISCEELGDRVVRFVETEIRPMIVAGREGKEWVAVANKNTIDAIRNYKEPVFRCYLVQSNARKLGYSMRGDFDTLQQLLSALNILTAYTGNPPSSTGASPDAFKKVDELYRNLTLASRPTSSQLPQPEAAQAKR
jgi:hypothetical protein